MMRSLISLLLALSLGVPALADADSAREPVTRLWDHLDTSKLRLKSRAALVVDDFGNDLYAKDADTPMPIASITKIMTAMVLLDARLPLDEPITVTKDDRDLLRLTGSRLRYGATLSRREMLILALMSSENRAAAALARTFPGGSEAFVARMNGKARLLGLYDTRFADATGLSADNVSTARDLARMVLAARRYPLINEATTRLSMEVRPYQGKGPLRYANTNRLLKNEAWEIEVSKTGYINEAGRCLVMLAEFRQEPVVLIFLNAFGKLTPMGDANRVRKWVEKGLESAEQVASSERTAAFRP
jgi:D-alanyl-D-alanine endopeptidase (penicillin-binding protein 7)